MNGWSCAAQRLLPARPPRPAQPSPRHAGSIPALPQHPRPHPAASCAPPPGGTPAPCTPGPAAPSQSASRPVEVGRRRAASARGAGRVGTRATQSSTTPAGLGPQSKSVGSSRTRSPSTAPRHPAEKYLEQILLILQRLLELLQLRLLPLAQVLLTAHVPARGGGRMVVYGWEGAQQAAGRLERGTACGGYGGLAANPALA